MTPEPSAARELEAIWHASFASFVVQSIHWWPDRLPSAALSAAARLRCLELRVDATPHSSTDDRAYDDAFANLRSAAVALLDTGALGLATRVSVSEPAPPSRLRSYKGLFRGAAQLRAGPRLEVELPYGPNTTVLMGFEPVDALDGYPGLGGTLILHPPPRIESYWRGLTGEVLKAHQNERGFWRDDTKLVASIVRERVAVMLFNHSPDHYWNCCVYYDVQQEPAIRWAWQTAHAEAHGTSI